MSDYTPTTEDIRHGYVADIMAAIDMTPAQHRKVSEAEFDRWLAAHDAEVIQQHADTIRSLATFQWEKADEDAIRADEREKAAQRVEASLSELRAYAYEVRMDWSDFDGRSNLYEVDDAIAKAVAAARGEGEQK